MENRIREIIPQPDWTLVIVFSDNSEGIFDIKPYFSDEAFEPLKNLTEFMKISNGGYFIEWECGADLSADTLHAQMKAVRNQTSLSTN